MDEKYKRLIGALLECEKKLSPWEKGFVKDLNDRFDSLSDKQKERLETIYRDRVDEGHEVESLTEGEIRGQKGDSGWVVVVNDGIVGSPMIKREVQVIVRWLRDNLGSMFGEDLPDEDPQQTEEEKDHGDLPF